MQLSLPTGKVMYISTYEFFFLLKDDDVADFYQACIADDLGIETNNPFSNSGQQGRIEVDEYDDTFIDTNFTDLQE